MLAWEETMGRSWIFAALLLTGSAILSPLAAMGGGGYGGGGGMGNMGGMQAMKLDDYSMALRLIHHEKYADAIPYLERALNDRPNNADVLNYLGYTHRMVGENQTSLLYYKKALAIDPDHKGAHEYMGELYLNMHDLTNANLQMAELVRLCPSDCDERDALTKAIADYQAANPPAAASATVSAPATPAPSAAATPTTQP
jgi:tetratricopeptide (TPR) repeat protein